MQKSSPTKWLLAITSCEKFNFISSLVFYFLPPLTVQHVSFHQNPLNLLVFYSFMHTLQLSQDFLLHHLCEDL